MQNRTKKNRTKNLEGLEEGLRKILEAALPAHCSSMVVLVAPCSFMGVRVAPIPFFNFKLFSGCGGTPTRWLKK